MTTGRPIEIDVPDAVHALGLLERVDYADAYSVRVDDGRTPEQVLRGFLRDAPPWFLATWAGVGTVLMGARFHFRAPGNAVGWRVCDEASAAPDAFAVRMDSAGGLHARLIALTPPGQAVVATLVGLDTAYARALWPAIRPAHRYVAPLLLARTVDRRDRLTKVVSSH